MSPNPRQGGTAPEPRGVRSAAPPTSWAGAPDRRTDCRAVLSDDPARDSRAALPPWGRRGPNRPPGRCRWVRLHTAVPPSPRAAARPLTGCAVRCGRSARDRRAALSPWGGTALTGALSLLAGGLHTAVPPCPRGAARPPIRPPALSAGAETAVSSLSVGRRGTRFAVASPVGRAAWTAVSPLVGGEGRHGLSCAPLSDPWRRGLDSRVALAGGRRATRRRRSSRSQVAGRRGVGPLCRPPCTRGRHGAHPQRCAPSRFPKRLPSGVAERLR